MPKIKDAFQRMYAPSRGGCSSSPPPGTCSANALGIYLVRNIMDDLYYERSEGRNLLYMTKKLE